MSDNVALILRDFPQKGDKEKEDRLHKDIALLNRFEDLLIAERGKVLSR